MTQKEMQNCQSRGRYWLNCSFFSIWEKPRTTNRVTGAVHQRLGPMGHGPQFNVYPESWLSTSYCWWGEIFIALFSVPQTVNSSSQHLTAQQLLILCPIQEELFSVTMKWHINHVSKDWLFQKDFHLSLANLRKLLSLFQRNVKWQVLKSKEIK